MVSKQRNLSSDSPNPDHQRVKKVGLGAPRNSKSTSLPSARRNTSKIKMRDTTPRSRTRDNTPSKMRNRTPVRKQNTTPLRTRASSSNTKSRDKTPSTTRAKSLQKKRNSTPNRTRDRDSTPNRSRKSTPSRSVSTNRNKVDNTPNRSRKVTPSRGVNTNRNKLPIKSSSRDSSLPTKSLESTPKKNRGRMSRFMKGGKKSKDKPPLSSLPSRVTDMDIEEYIKTRPEYLVKRQGQYFVPPAEELQHTKIKETKKNSQHVENSRSTQQNEKAEFVGGDAKCGGSSILKTADNAVLDVGYYFGKGIVAIVDGVRDSSCAQVKPPSSVVDRFQCNAGGTFDEREPSNYESKRDGEKNKRAYLYDDEGKRILREAVSAQY